MKRRIVCVLLVLLLAVGIGFAMPMAAETETEAEIEVTRSQWLQKLVATFEMTVEDGVYPDNYFSDLSSSSQYYYDMLLAVEFGVVDIPAGGELRPDDPATREFAAQTLNFCLGFQLGEDAEYTYPEADDVTYPDDIQVSIDREWFSLTEDGAFLPEQPITSAEADVMIADAEEILAATGLDENFTNVYEFAEGVVEVPGWANVTKSGENEITITDCPVELEQGQQFAVYFGNVPSVYTAEAIEETENSLVISTVRVADEEAFTELELQGSTYLDPTSIEAVDGGELTFIDPYSGEEYTDPYAIPAPMSSRAVQFPQTFKETLELPVVTGTSVRVEITVENAVVDYKVSMKDMSAEVTFDADVDVSLSYKGDLMEILQSPLKYNEIRVINATAPGVGGFVVALDLELSADISAGFETKMHTGISYSLLGGPRIIKNFNAKHFTLKAEGTAQLGVIAKLGLTDLPVIKGYVYGKVGVEGSFSDVIRGSDVVPARCKHVAAYLYASYGVEGKVKFGKFEEKLELDVPVYDENNSPIRVVHHYEDGKEVPGCTVGDSGTSSYYTPTESRYWESGTSSTNASSVAYNKNGQAVTLWQYTLDDAGNATITRYLGSNTHVVIPSTIDGHTVTGIASTYYSGYYVSIFGSRWNHGAYNNTRILSVEIPDSVTNIGSYAFANCVALKTVDLGNGVISIGDYAFDHCTALQSVNIGDSVIGVGNYAFRDCTALQSVTFGEDSVTIGDYAFQNCTDLQFVSLGKGTATVGQYAFDGCTSMTKIEVNGSIVPGGNAFRNCTALEEVHISNIAAWCATNFPNTIANPLYNETALYVNGEPVGDLVVPDSVTAIGAYAFYNCTNLTSVDIPDSVTTIGGYAFSRCIAMTSVELPDAPIYIKRYAFASSGLTSIHLPVGTMIEWSNNGGGYDDSGYIYKNYSPFSACDNLQTVSFEEGWANIPNNLFEGCTGLRELIIPETVTEIGWYAFKGCTALETVAISDSVLTIKPYAFSECTALKELTLSNNLETLGAYAFEYCTDLKTVHIPKSLIKTGYLYRNANHQWTYGPVFMGCSALEEVSFEAGTTKIMQYLFGDTGVEELVIPDTVQQIQTAAFSNCARLKCVTMGSNVTSIYSDAFKNCDALENLNTAASVGAAAFYDCDSLKSVKTGTAGSDAFSSCDALEYALVQRGSGDSAFSYCTALTTVTVGGGVGDYAFAGCTALTTATVNSGSIGGYAFQNCTDLEQVTLGNGVTSIGTYCFYNCISLTDVTLSSGMTSVPSYAFSQCAKLRKITIPRGVTSIGSYAFHACPLLTEITIPREVTSIDATAFSYPARMYIYGVAGTYAQTYADTYEATFIDRQTLAQSASLNKDTLFINRGLTEQLILTAEPMEHTDAVTWKSSNTNVVTVDQKGNVRAVNLGTATIKVTVGDDISASCKVTVTQPVTSIGLNISAITLEALDTYQLVASVSPSNAFDKSVTWESSDEKIASVDENGLVTAHSKGTATITVRTKDGSNLARSCTINVTNTAYVVDNLSKFQSLHSYPNNCSDNWILTLPGQESIPVTFDERTNIEEDFDYLYIYDGQGKLIGTYTGTTLAGQTVTVPGDTVKIRLISDESGRTWGFKVIDVGVQLCEHETLKDVSESNGDRTHTNRTLCANCEKVFTKSVADCADEDGDYTCDICAGDLTCRHGDGEIFYECLEDGEHLMSVVCTICRETVYTDERVCDDRNADGICDQCQTTIPVEPEIEKFSVAGSNMTLGNELVVNVMFMKNKVSGSDNTIEVVHGDAVTTIAQADWESYNAAMYVVRIPVAAKEMADALTVTIKNADGLEISNAYSTSVRDYAMKVLAGNLSTYNQNMKNLAVDMLNYGAAAQMSFSYNTDDMANSLLTDEYKQWASADVVCDNDQVKGTNCAGSNLSLESKILLNIVFRLTDADKTGKYAVASYTDYTGKEISYRVENADFGRLNASMQGVVVDEIVLADAFSLVTVTIFNSDGTIYGTGSDSVESYAARVESDLNKAIMKFALSAKTYLSK